MNKFFRRLPLLAKLLIIAIVPMVFIIFLTIQIYNEKSKNVDQIKTYLNQIQHSSTLARLTDQLQKERRFSFDYALMKNHQVQMVSERPITDSLLKALELSGNETLRGFTEYTFLENR